MRIVLTILLVALPGCLQSLYFTAPDEAFVEGMVTSWDDSPVEEVLAFATVVSGVHQIAVLDWGSREFRPWVAVDGRHAQNPALSPDGNFLAFSATSYVVDDYCSRTQSDIYVHDLDTGEQRLLLALPDGHYPITIRWLGNAIWASIDDVPWCSPPPPLQHTHAGPLISIDPETGNDSEVHRNVAPRFSGAADGSVVLIESDGWQLQWFEEGELVRERAVPEGDEDHCLDDAGRTLAYTYLVEDVPDSEWQIRIMNLSAGEDEAWRTVPAYFHGCWSSSLGGVVYLDRFSVGESNGLWFWGQGESSPERVWPLDAGVES